MLRPLLILLTLLAPPLASAEPRNLHPDLQLEGLTPRVTLHRSWLTVTGFGRVECNGLVYHHNGEALVIDSPGSAELARILLADLASQGLTVKGFVVGHTHQDSMGGLEVFQELDIPTYASFRCQDLAASQGKPVPDTGFDHRLRLRVGGEPVELFYPGPGHAPDNSVTYLPSEKILFGGCLIKALEAGPGNLEDADTAAWPKTVDTVSRTFPEATLVVPGHGPSGDRSLLEYTREMFAQP